MAFSEHDEKPLYIVGIGASAGGLKALEELFDNTPADSGMAFVVVQHLSPDFKSKMDELLRHHTAMPIQIAADTMALEANNIYLLPSSDTDDRQGRETPPDRDRKRPACKPAD